MTEALAIIGAVTGVTGSILAALGFFRDRPKVVVTFSEGGRPTQDGGYEWYVSLFIANHGRQPIAITAAGLKQVRRMGARRRLAKMPGLFAEGTLMLLYRAGVSEERLGRWHNRILRKSGVTLVEQLWRAFDDPVLLGLGELRQYELPAPKISDLLEEDERDIPIHAYADDSYGRTVLSRDAFGPMG